MLSAGGVAEVLRVVFMIGSPVIFNRILLWTTLYCGILIDFSLYSCTVGWVWSCPAVRLNRWHNQVKNTSCFLSALGSVCWDFVMLSSFLAYTLIAAIPYTEALQKPQTTTPSTTNLPSAFDLSGCLFAGACSKLKLNLLTKWHLGAFKQPWTYSFPRQNYLCSAIK